MNGNCVKPLLPPATPAAEIDKALSDSASPAEKLAATISQMPSTGTTRAVCECAEGFGGSDCSFRLCPKDCSGSGVCHSGVCWCQKG